MEEGAEEAAACFEYTSSVTIEKKGKHKLPPDTCDYVTVCEEVLTSVKNGLQITLFNI